MHQIDISSLDSLERKLYQLIISRLDGEKLASDDYREGIRRLAGKGIGGFILFGGERDEIRNFIKELQSIAAVPLFIASDIERGVAQQIEGTSPFPCQMAVAAAIDRNNPDEVRLLEDAVRAVAAEAGDLGINMPLIPVMDVNLDPDNPIICTRAFSDDPGEVAWFGSRYISVLEGVGLISCAKHFPGHGDTSVDSHISLPVIAKPKQELMETEIAPFAAAIKAGAGSIMVGHLTAPALDSRPASLSKKVITGLLREELGYDGLVLTDALNMNALDGIGNITVECLNAGADILLHPLDADAAVKELLEGCRSKRLDEERLEEAVRRIMQAKAKLRASGPAGTAPRGHTELSSRIVAGSITLVKGTGSVPVSFGAPAAPINTEDAHLVFAGDAKAYELSPLKKAFARISPIGETGEISAGTAIFALFTSVAAWRGSSGIDVSERERILRLIETSRKSVVVSFGSPYVLRYFHEADILIAAYEASGQAQEAVLGCLRGESGFKGRLPVRLGMDS
ncbi:MAG TPA: glycoside hydrolase family 3 N-terminal domain-containing protein [Dissulfurispiraceae bacterium]